MNKKDYKYIMNNLKGNVRLCRNTVLLKIIEIITDNEPDLDYRIAAPLLMLRAQARTEMHKRNYGRRSALVGKS